MKLRLMSDLHLEFDRTEKSQFSLSVLEGDKDTVLMLAGDIDVGKQVIPFFQKMSEQFLAVVAVFGNHDYWTRDLDTHPARIKQLIINHGLNNVHLLNNECVVINNEVAFHGGTLWTNFDKKDPIAMFNARCIMNDYARIRTRRYTRPISPEDILSEHMATSRFFFEKDLSPDLKHVAISHHAPSFKSIPNHFISQALKPLYASEYGDKIAYSNFALWHHGHVHRSGDYYLGDCRVICNPRGYFRSELNHEFNERLVIEI